jgi:hypothetical protein
VSLLVMDCIYVIALLCNINAKFLKVTYEQSQINLSSILLFILKVLLNYILSQIVKFLRLRSKLLLLTVKFVVDLGSGFHWGKPNSIVHYQ